VAGLNIPQHDYIAFTYHGATNNAATVTYREGGATGTIVATVTFTYTTQPPTVDNTPLATVTRSLMTYNALTGGFAPSAPSAAAPLAREVSTYADLPLDSLGAGGIGLACSGQFRYPALQPPRCRSLRPVIGRQRHPRQRLHLRRQGRADHRH
jgi:hypothetical protein